MACINAFETGKFGKWRSPGKGITEESPFSFSEKAGLGLGMLNPDTFANLISRVRIYRTRPGYRPAPAPEPAPAPGF
jgi:hypothetical protein